MRVSLGERLRESEESYAVLESGWLPPLFVSFASQRGNCRGSMCSFEAPMTGSIQIPCCRACLSSLCTTGASFSLSTAGVRMRTRNRASLSAASIWSHHPRPPSSAKWSFHRQNAGDLRWRRTRTASATHSPSRLAKEMKTSGFDADIEVAELDRGERCRVDHDRIVLARGEHRDDSVKISMKHRANATNWKISPIYLFSQTCRVQPEFPALAESSVESFQGERE